MYTYKEQPVRLNRTICSERLLDWPKIFLMLHINSVFRAQTDRLSGTMSPPYSVVTLKILAFFLWARF